MKYTAVTPKFKEDFLKLVSEASSIVVTAHRGPDEDAIASALSTYDFIVTRFPEKNIQVVLTGEYDDSFKTFKHYDKIKFVPELAESFDSLDLLIVLDGSRYERFTKKQEELKKRVGRTICIDHHSSPEEFDLSLVDPETSSAVELIYLTLFEGEKIAPHLAEIFLLGILGDTGNFLYLKPSQTNTLAIAKRLMEIGNIEIQEFQSRYRLIPKRVFNLIQKFIANTEYHELDDWPNYQTSFISEEEKKLGNYTNSEVGEASQIYMAHYLRLITGYPWGFVITPNNNGVFGVSLRSLPNSVSVRDMMERMGIGGGHDRASGGDLEDVLKIKECFKMMQDWMSKNKPLRQ